MEKAGADADLEIDERWAELAGFLADPGLEPLSINCCAQMAVEIPSVDAVARLRVLHETLANTQPTRIFTLAVLRAFIEALTTRPSASPPPAVAASSGASPSTELALAGKLLDRYASANARAAESATAERLRSASQSKS